MAAVAETGGAIVAVEEDEIVTSFRELAMRGFRRALVCRHARFCAVSCKREL